MNEIGLVEEVERLRDLLRRGAQAHDKWASSSDKDFRRWTRQAWVNDVHAYFAGIGETAYVKGPGRTQ